MKKTTLAAVILAAGLDVAAHAQTLLYQWAFTNSTDTFSNSAPSYAFTPGTGGLQLVNVSGNATDPALIGADGVNQLIYFTNASAGPGFGPGVNAQGALVANGQGYNGGNSATAMATNLNLGNQYQITVCFWIKLGNLATGATTFGQFARPVMVAASPAYDVGGKGSGNHNGMGFSYNGWTTSPNANQLQNGLANATAGDQPQVTITGIPASGPIYPTGIAADGSVWYFEAMSYDGTVAVNNNVWWLGTLTTNVYPMAVRSYNFSAINFTTNAYVFIGGNNVAGSARAVSSGALADVRIYSGILNSNQLEAIRTFNSPALTPPSLAPASVSSGPNSGSSFVSGSRTFSVAATGNPATFTCLWRSNNVAVTGATNASFTLTNIQLAANGSSYFCSVSNSIGGTNSPAAVLTVVTATPGTFACAVLTNNPYSFWKVNEPTNAGTFPVYDYANGHDGSVAIGANMFFVGGPASPNFPGFAPDNTGIQTRPNLASQLDLANPADFPNTGMTICGWVNTPVLIPAAGNGLIFDLISDTGGGFGLQAGANDGVRNQISYQWGGTSYDTGLYFNTNDWTFIALVVTTNLSQADVNAAITADTNVYVYVGSHRNGLQVYNNNTALNGAVIANGTSASPLALGRTTVAASEHGGFYAVNNAQFNSVAVLYQALSAQSITNLYLQNAGVYVFEDVDPNTPGNLLLTYPLGTLQSAPAVTGAYTPVSGAASPWSVAPSDPQRFYRLSYP